MAITPFAFGLPKQKRRKKGRFRKTSVSSIKALDLGMCSINGLHDTNDAKVKITAGDGNEAKGKDQWQDHCSATRH